MRIKTDFPHLVRRIDHQVGWITIDGMHIPVLSLGYEYTAYLALGRAERAEMLRTWLQEDEHADHRSQSE